MMIGAIGSFGGAGGLAAWQQMQFTHRMRNAAATAAAPVEPAAKEAPAKAASAAALGGAAAKALPFGPSEMPYVPNGYGPVELAARTRVRYPDAAAQNDVENREEAEQSVLPGMKDGGEEAVQKSGLPGAEDDEEKWNVFPPDEDEGEDLNGDGKISESEKAASAEDATKKGKCETCEKRKYKDGSDDPGVSFKTAQHVDPRMAQAAVRGHEMEHVVRERAKAQREGRRVISQSVTYHSGICPECGRFYVSGGTTRTVTAADNSKDMLDLLHSGKKCLDVSA